MRYLRNEAFIGKISRSKQAEQQPHSLIVWRVCSPIKMTKSKRQNRSLNTEGKNNPETAVDPDQVYLQVVYNRKQQKGDADYTKKNDYAEIKLSRGRT